MGRSLRILVAEDSQEDTTLLLHKIARAGFDIVHERVESLDAMRAALDKHPWDVLVTDHSMPKLSPIDALELLREKNIDLPTIVVSGTIEPQAAVAAMKAGASDFIMKDDMTRLIPALERELREAQNRQARRKAEEQFRQAQKMESIGRLASGVAHDFNNLLTGILGYCSFVLGNLNSNDPNFADVQEIKTSAERAAVLTRQLLAFSRQQIIQMKTIDLNAVVSNMTNLLRRLIGEDIELDVSLEKDLGCISADPGQIEQVLMNLCVNARDAMPKGGRLTLRTENIEINEEASMGPDIAQGSYVMVSVGDTGTGMSQEVVSHMYEPFFTTKEAGKGTGLGLSTVFGIVKQSSGHIVVDTEPGKGTTFKILFHRAQGAVEALSQGQGAVPSLRGSETILLVEDDESVRRLAARMLSKQGYGVLEAKSADEAIRLRTESKDPVRLMITDLVMPGMSGDELVERMASLAPNIKVLCMSGYTDVAYKGSLKSNIHFLQKPYSMDDLAHKVRAILDS